MALRSFYRVKDSMRQFKSARYFIAATTVALTIVAPRLFADKQNNLQGYLEEHAPTDGYQVNFSNVSALEVIKFLSKVGKYSIIYNEADLGFSVSITSEHPTPLPNLISALAQVMKINGLDLIQEGATLIITKTGSLRAISPIVSDKTIAMNGELPAIITRIFTVNSANPSALAAIVKQMTTPGAYVELSLESRQLIVTDVTSSIESISSLLAQLDGSSPSLEFFSYTAQHDDAVTLSMTLERILSPLLNGNPCILAPQDSSNTLFIVTTPYLLQQIKNYLAAIDNPNVVDNKKLSGENVLVYQIHNQAYTAIREALLQIASDLDTSSNRKPDLVKSIDSQTYITSSNSIAFTGTKEALAELQTILKNLDTPVSQNYIQMQSSDLLIYQIKHSDEEAMESSVDSLIHHLKNSANPDVQFLAALESMKYIPETNSFSFTGTPQVLPRVKELLTSIDIPVYPLDGIPEKTAFFVYKPKYYSGDQLLDSLDEIAIGLKTSGLSDPALIQTIESAKWVAGTNTIVFTGDQATLTKIEGMLPELDSSGGSQLLTASSNFYIYRPKYRTGDEILRHLKEMYKSLSDEDLADEGFLHTINSARYIPSTNTLIFTGDPKSLSEMRSLLPVVDEQESSSATDTIYVFKLGSFSKTLFDQGVDKISTDLTDNDPAKEALISRTYVPEANAYIFKGSPSVILRVKQLLSPFDNAGSAPVSKKGYFLYKLQNVSGKVVLSDLEEMADNLKRSQIDDPELLEALDSVQYVRSTNSIYISGTPAAIDQVKGFISDFDVPRRDQNQQFFMYKPQNVSLDELKESVIEVADDLRSANIDDPDLITSLVTVRVNESSQSLIFTGSTDTIVKIKQLLPSLDSLAGGFKINKDGQSTFLIYKIKSANGPTLVAQLKAVAGDLKVTGSADTDLLKTLETLRYVPETNSIVFTGSNAALERALNLAEKFDVGSSLEPRKTPEGYVLYSPKYISGEELIQYLKDFEQNLVSSGVSDTELFDTINNLKWMASTQSIVISGAQGAITKVQSLLEKFDVPGKGSQARPQIETIDDTGFLIYKLQYHQGGEITSALKTIGSDLRRAASGSGKPLVDAIDSVQWIQATNSLIATGNSDTLTKLKDIIQNVDIPLRQVFIEVLVVETVLADELAFGLRWQSQGLYKNRLGYNTGTLPAVTTSGVDPFAAFNNAVNAVSATAAPSASNMYVPASGWDLGVIGDVILHKGKSYFALGSLLSALQTDANSTVVLNQKIIAQDNQPSTVFVGSNIPYVGSVVSTTQNSGVQQNTNLEYRDIGVNLTITPTIGDEDILTLDIDESITEEENDGSSDSSSLQTGQINGIRTSKTTTQTRVTLPDNHFLALSGMIRNQVTRTVTGIPCLGGLPIVGAFMSQNERNIEKRNVIIFVRPHIINSFEQYKQITQQQEDLYRSLNVPEDFDEALDFVKTPDDEQ